MAYYKVMLVGKTFEVVEATSHNLDCECGTLEFFVQRGKKSVLTFLCLTETIIGVERIDKKKATTLKGVP